jgi:hypothetical protein
MEEQMKKILMVILLIIEISCSKFTVKVVDSSEIEGYDHIYDVVSTCIAKYIAEDIITYIRFDFGHKDKELNLVRIYLEFDYGYYNDKDTINNTVEENIINDLFNIFCKESKILKISDLSIIKYYPFKIKFMNNKIFSKEEMEIFKNGIYEELKIPIFEFYESYCEGYIAVKAEDYLSIEKIKEYAEKNFKTENDIEI